LNIKSIQPVGADPYNFYDFRSKDIDFTFVDPTIAAEFGTQTVSTQLRIHSVTAGVNYKFWGW
jgi:opacity protein-like surface antigen